MAIAHEQIQQFSPVVLPGIDPAPAGDFIDNPGLFAVAATIGKHLLQRVYYKNNVGEDAIAHINDVVDTLTSDVRKLSRMPSNDQHVIRSRATHFLHGISEVYQSFKKSGDEISVRVMRSMDSNSVAFFEAEEGQEYTI